MQVQHVLDVGIINFSLGTGPTRIWVNVYDHSNTVNILVLRVSII